ncbi:hypothetical protein ABZY09_02800 [Streptomyces sp. NPDC002928]|uniref:hypothetical protein n=1 Tax=Streptomyces sp. NPDC002928 TaxID=3154440 RepID=UPI0033B2AFA4
MPGAPGVDEASSAGATAVGGSWLPPDISAVLASGDTADGVLSSASLSGGANTVAGSGTERSSPESPLVSVPAQGVAPAGTPGAPARVPAPSPLSAPAEGHDTPPPDAPPCESRESRESRPPGALAPPCAPDGPDAPDAPPDEPDAPGTPGAPACVSGSEPPPPDTAPSPRRSGLPSLSAASCNHSGGLNKNDV